MAPCALADKLPCLPCKDTASNASLPCAMTGCGQGCRRPRPVRPALMKQEEEAAYAQGQPRKEGEDGSRRPRQAEASGAQGRPDHPVGGARRPRDDPARDDAVAGEDGAFLGVQPRPRLFDGAVQRAPGDDPPGPGHPDPPRLADPGDEGGGKILRGRHPRRRPVPAQRPGFRRQPRHRHLHVQAGLLQGRAGLLDGVQGPPDRHRRPGAGRLQPGSQGDIRRVPAHPADQDLGPGQAAQRHPQHDLHQHARPARPGRRLQRADRRLPGRRAQPDRHARQVRQGDRRCLHRRTARHGRPAHARPDPHRARRHL